MSRFALVAVGVSASTASLKRMERDFPNAFFRGIRRWLERVASESQGEVPWITGRLARSMRITLTKAHPISGTIRYTAPYAGFVHEVPRPPTSNGKWKFLEDPWKRNLPSVEATVGAEVRAAAKRASR